MAWLGWFVWIVGGLPRVAQLPSQGSASTPLAGAEWTGRSAPVGGRFERELRRLCLVYGVLLPFARAGSLSVFTPSTQPVHRVPINCVAANAGPGRRNKTAHGLSPHFSRYTRPKTVSTKAASRFLILRGLIPSALARCSTRSARVAASRA